MNTFFKNWKQDLPSSLVVFLVALPLCLGVGLASTNLTEIDGMPNIFSGIIAGIVGGIVVGALSGSKLGVSGPAAGLITIVLGAIVTLGSFEAFLTAVIISGVIQLIAGFLQAGMLSKYFPVSVIKGMLAAIGLTLILKEIPHAVGYDKDFMGDIAFAQTDGHNTFSELFYMLNSLSFSAIGISILSIVILVLFETSWMKKIALFKFLPGALFVVLIGVGINQLLAVISPENVLAGDHLVKLPVAQTLSEFGSFFATPDFGVLNNPDVYVIGFTLALIASLETLLSVEATDKLDPNKNHTPPNRELKAQGVGNIISGLLGGLPITQVIVRSSANINTGAKSKLSTIVHGILLLTSVLFIPTLLNLIPLASLAGILIVIGYKLSKIQVYRDLYRLGLDQFLPFLSTVIAVLLTDLLTGIAIGFAFSVFFILRKNYKNNYRTETSTVDGEEELKIVLSEEVSFLNKASISLLLMNLKDNQRVIIDGSKCKSIDYDALEVIREFRDFNAKEKNIQLSVINLNQLG